jgi:steroid delta-isomerase-like uncharacterized protein
LTIPKDRNEFVQHMHHNYVVVYDNVRIAPKWFSDEICKAITGAGNSKRKLYTDDEDIAYNYKRCIQVNGINNVLTEPDALDRSVMLDFTRTSDEERREEAEVDAEFEAMKPGLLGYIFDILAKAVSLKPTIKLERKPRMADFAVWGEVLVSSTQYSFHPSGMPNMDWNEYKQLLAAITRAFPDLHHDIKDMIAEGDKVAVRLNVTGTHKGKFQGIPPSDRKLSLDEMAFLTIIDGRITEGWIISDTMSFMQQIGATPTNRCIKKMRVSSSLRPYIFNRLISK